MIERQTQAYSDDEIYGILNPVVGGWFRSKFGTFAPPQKYAVMNIHQRQNTLITAPTGSGKTLSAFLSVLNELTTLSMDGKLEDKVYCVYISPLKALNNDIERNLNEPLAEISELAKSKGKEIGVRVAVRTGDTTPAQRAKQLTKPPHILITTPETLAILLCAPKFREYMRDVKWCVVDEIHALASNKRGVHLNLSLERLQNLAGGFTRIGLSATIWPLERVAEYLVGYENGKPRDCKMVDVQNLKGMDLEVLSPVDNIVETSEPQLHGALYRLLDQLIQEHKTTLIFTNTRSATERVVHYLKENYPARYTDNIGAHHSSLSKEHRLKIEEKLKKGELKAVVCSTSLELGIDIGYIDLVILLGSPKSVARMLQRVGRSGHKLHDKAKGRIVVMDRDDLVECAVLLKNALEGHIDSIDIPQNCLDVLAQQIYGIAIENRQHIENVWSLVKRAYCYRNLARDDFDSVIKYLAGEYMSLEARNVYAKIWYDSTTGEMGRRGHLARVLYSTNIGTIPEESFILVKEGDRIIGEIDEGFLERLAPGDIFVLGGDTYRYGFARGMTAQVQPAPGRAPTVPSWVSEQLPLSFEMAMEIQRFRRLMEEKFTAGRSKQEIIDFINSYLYVDEKAANSIYEYFREQFLYAEIPHDKKLLIEFYTNPAGDKYAIFHSCYGRRVNDALSRAIAYAIFRTRHRNVYISLTDHGFLITACSNKIQAIQGLQALRTESLRAVVEKATDKSEVLRRRFRHCASRALMILRSYKGKHKSVGRQQLSSTLLLSTCRYLPNDFPILREAKREVLEDLMDIRHAEEVLADIEHGRVKTKMAATTLPSPFALALLSKGYSDLLKLEDRLEFIRRMHDAIKRRIDARNPSN